MERAPVKPDLAIHQFLNSLNYESPRGTSVNDTKIALMPRLFALIP